MKYLLSIMIVVVCGLTVAEAPPLKEILITIPPASLENVNVNEQRVNDLEILHPTFRNKVIRLLHECSKQGIKLQIVETYRTPERQNELRRRGFSMLHGGKSKH